MTVYTGYVVLWGISELVYYYLPRADLNYLLCHRP